MSADNGIYILKTRTHFKPMYDENGEECGAENLFNKFIFVWRVAHIQAFDNLKWFEKNQPYNIGAYLANVFKESKKHLTEDGAMIQALDQSKEYDILEYGINFVDKSDLIFYGD